MVRRALNVMKDLGITTLEARRKRKRRDFKEGVLDNERYVQDCQERLVLPTYGGCWKNDKKQGRIQYTVQYTIHGYDKFN